MLANAIVHFAKDVENMPMLACLTLANISLSQATLLEHWKMLCLIHQTKKK
jgi:hypothetical protein